MDITEIKNRLAAMQTKPKSANKAGEEKKNYAFKPTIGKQVIRVLPSKFNKSNPFSELYFHYNIKNKVMISPTSWGEKDPIVEFSKQLAKTGDLENWKLSKKISPKMRVFVPVIVRGQEEEGVKLWQFGKETYMDFLNLADNEDVGDYTDIAEGRDITLTTVGPDVTGTDYNKTSIMPSMKTTPLSKDKNQINDWLENQPNPIDTYKKYTFEEMKAALQEWLTPSEDEETNQEEETEKPVTNTSPSPKYKTPTPPATKEKPADKFEALFNEDEGHDPGLDGSGDLPF